MDWIRGWAAVVCAAALLCAVWKYLMPEGTPARTFRLLVAAFFLCCCLYPLQKTAEFSLPSFETPPPTNEQLLLRRVVEQLAQQVRLRTEEIVGQALEAQHIKSKKTQVTVDTDAHGGIYIKRIEVWIDRSQRSKAVTARQLLLELLETDVLVHVEAG
ncbi:MAG: hypothetical protein IKI50_07380 [Clostridia bacterium]|nr:hypothetical protein [Clostridia bacterium]